MNQFRCHSPLRTDFYELTMMQGYFKNQRDTNAVFDYFFRRNPFNGGYAVFAGLDTLLDGLENLHFQQEELDYLRSLNHFDDEFLEYLRNFRFQGQIYAMPEGTLAFANEPILRIYGTLLETQLIEPMLLNLLNFQTLIATKTARIFEASHYGSIMEFGLRRAHGPNGGLFASRAAFIGGASASSNVEAGYIYGIPVRGTMAHSWIMSYPDELSAFRAYAQLYPDNCTLLADTYNTLESGIPNAIIVLKELQATGRKGFGVRLDSGDLDFLSKKSRKMLNDAGLPEAEITVSNELDEYIIDHLVHENAPINKWGVGTRMVTGGEDSSLTGVYKMAARQTNGDLEATMKLTNNPEKMSNPGIKNTARFFDENGQALADLIFLETERSELEQISRSLSPIPFYHPHIDFAQFTMKNYAYMEILLQPVMKDGSCLCEKQSLTTLQKRARNSLKSLDNTSKRLINPHIYKVSISQKLKELKTDIIKSHLR
jgi:nicotinate phosphoribosyltransferase